MKSAWVPSYDVWASHRGKRFTLRSRHDSREAANERAEFFFHKGLRVQVRQSTRVKVEADAPVVCEQRRFREAQADRMFQRRLDTQRFKTPGSAQTHLSDR